MGETTRREFVRTAGIGAAASALPATLHAGPRRGSTRRGGDEKLILGMASYTFRNFDLEDTLAMTGRLGLERICFKSFHLPLESTEEEIRSTVSKARGAGIEPYGCGVVYMRNEAEVHQAFDYAAAAGMQVIVGVPNHELLDLVDSKAGQFNIQVAIHNHGPGDQLYPTPESAYLRIRDLDPRVGLCLDAGHTRRAGIDPAESARRFSDRLLDVHIKDVSEASSAGSTVEIGRGVTDIPELLRTLIDVGYAGTVAFEHEKDAGDPLPGVAESVGYVRGVLSALGG